MWIACGKPCESVVNFEGLFVDHGEIRWITLWRQKYLLTSGFSSFRLIPLRRHDPFVHRRAGSPVPSRDIGAPSASGEDDPSLDPVGRPSDSRAEMATRPPGATPTGEPSEQTNGNNRASFIGGSPRPGNPGWSAGHLAAPPGVLRSTAKHRIGSVTVCHRSNAAMNLGASSPTAYASNSNSDTCSADSPPSANVRS